MLGGRDLAGRALDQRGKVLKREPADLDAPTLGHRVEEPKQAARRAVVDVGPRLGGHHAALASIVQLTPITG
jgi:hypothetical protein